MKKLNRPNKQTFPRAPARLSTESRKVWDEVVRDWHLDASGLLILSGALDALDRMRQAQASIAANGITTTDRWDQVKANPAVQIERDSRSALLAGFKALNLDLEPLRDKAGRPPGS